MRTPTRPQKIMIGLMAGVFALLGLWLIPELIGVISPEVEDTFSEWVWDLPWPAVLGISGLFGLTGAVFVWSAGHFIEGYRRRK